MIKPILQGEAFLADVKEAGKNKRELNLWWLGQSGFLLQFHGAHALIDPYLSDSLTVKYAATDKPHVRMTELVVTPERLDFIDVATSSHNHTDHFDPETLNPLLEVNPKLKLILPEANRAIGAERLKMDPRDPRLIEANAGDTKAVGTVRFHGIPAAHNELDTDDRGHHKFLGYIIELGRWRIYHSGDSKLFPGIEDWVRPFRPDIAILPINGDLPERRVAGNFAGPEAAKLAKDIGTKIVIPCHYDMFEFNTVTPDLFVKSCETIGQKFKVMQSGERWSASELVG